VCTRLFSSFIFAYTIILYEAQNEAYIIGLWCSALNNQCNHAIHDRRKLPNQPSGARQGVSCWGYPEGCGIRLWAPMGSTISTSAWGETIRMTLIPSTDDLLASPDVKFPIRTRIGTYRRKDADDS